MAKTIDGYDLLLKRGSRGSLWLADDHLLVIETSCFLLCYRETYRRLDYANIQAVTHCKSPRGVILHVVIGLLLAVWLTVLLTIGTDGGPGTLLAVVWGVISLGLLVIHWVKGPTCNLVVQTAVKPWRLRMVSRQKHADVVLAALESRCGEAQVDLAGAPSEAPGEAAPAVVDDSPRVVGPHPVALPAWICLLAYAVMIAGEMMWNELPATLLMLVFSGAAFILLLMATNRGGGANAVGGRGWLLSGLGVLAIDVAAGYLIIFSTMMQGFAAGGAKPQQQVSMLKTLARMPEGSPDALVAGVYVLAAATAAVALGGMIAVLRRGRLYRSSQATLPENTP